MKIIALAIGFAAGAAVLADHATAEPVRDAILSDFLAQAKQDDPEFAGFSAERGEAFFHAVQTGGKADTPSCTTCHSEKPQDMGRTRAGKVIEPIAVSATPMRFTDRPKVEKWFGRNCNSVLGRECTAAEKGDFITFMVGQ